jgi:hypothetical protein
MSQISQEELEEFNDIFGGLQLDLQGRVSSLLTNYKLQKSEFASKFETHRYNLSRDRENQTNSNVSVDQEIVQQIEDDLQSSRQAGRKSGHTGTANGYQQIKSRASLASKGKTVE